MSGARCLYLEVPEDCTDNVWVSLVASTSESYLNTIMSGVWRMYLKVC